MSGSVQVFGCRRDDAIHALRRPASEKRQMPKNWEFALAGTGTTGTAIFAPHERSLRLANMTAALIVGVLVPRAERSAGAVVDALPAFGSRASAKVRRFLRRFFSALSFLWNGQAAELAGH